MIPSLISMGLAVAAAASPQDKGQSPVFGATVDVVAIDVGVVSTNGAPVRGLGPGDFTLTLDKKPRRVVSVDYVDDGPLAEEAEVVADPVPREYSSNQREARGRLILLVVDQGNITAGSGQGALAAAEGWLDRLNPGDHVGLVTIPNGGPRVEFTRDHQQVRSALQHLVGRGYLGSRRVTLLEALAYTTQDDPERWRGAVERECGSNATCARLLESEAWSAAERYRKASNDSLAMLRATFDAMKTIEGRKTLVLITEGLGEPGGGSRFGMGYVSAIRDLSPAAAAARVSLFAVQASRDTGLPDMMSNVPGGIWEDRNLHELGVETLLEATHGEFFKGDPQKSFDRVARETSGYYLVGLEAEPGDRNGKEHDLRVSVSRPDVTVRSRRSVRVSPPASSKEIDQTLASALRAPQPLTELPLRVATYARSDAAAGKVRIVISAEVASGRLVPGLSAAYLLLDGKGKVVANGAELAAAKGDNVAGSLVTSVALEPGLYTLRLAATDLSRRVGRVDHAVKGLLVDLAEPGLQASDLLLGPVPPKGAPMRPGVALVSGGDPLVADLELYSRDAEKLRSLSVVFEIGSDAQSPALRSSPGRVVASPKGGRILAQGVVSLEGLAPGGYVVRAVVGRGGRAIGSLSHGFRVTPPEGGKGE